MTRRSLLQAGLAAALPSFQQPSNRASRSPMFKLNYAPHFGMFSNHAGSDPVAELKYAADQGFRAWEDNGMKGRSAQDQEKITKAMADLGITMGVFVVNGGTAWSPTLAAGDQGSLDKFLQECRECGRGQAGECQVDDRGAWRD